MQCTKRHSSQFDSNGWITILAMVSIYCCGSVFAADPPSQDDLETRYQEEQRAQLEAYFDRRLEASYGERAAAWQRDFSSVEAYEKSIAPWRKRFAEYLGGMKYNLARRAVREELIRET